MRNMKGKLKMRIEETLRTLSIKSVIQMSSTICRGSNSSNSKY
jgi:hypothetical protein